MSAQVLPTRPRRRPHVLLMVGVLLLAIGLVALVLEVSASMSRKDASGVYPIAGPFTALDVQAEASGVSVAYADVAEAEVRFDQGNARRSYELTVDSDNAGGTAQVRLTQHNPRWWSWDIWGGSSPRLEVLLPRDMEANPIAVNLSTSAGNLSLDGTFGDAGLNSTAGNLTVTGSARDVTLAATAGNISAIDYHVTGRALVHTTAGNATLDFGSLPAGLAVETTAGNQTTTLPKGSYRIQTEATIGTVSIDATSTPDAARTYTFSATAGDIEVAN
ncbi:DUF4097 family beta strand repeat-containing protein [Arthrobacter sp. I2-34]|uniref:DUF4097 family beta strand repeat-containing protein n=1 Tax=Arthrobacter hankyongi TaxID=2904801 RepID=A0ABS9L3Y6_9MICC|nr:DUF4097 family beta strand repeat-containing protein [Arthrobacter hankyongi]MCG2621417.1 DUF4097 family beta strand repeat-containing protein [Arthrobacter hankyongi]